MATYSSQFNQNISSDSNTTAYCKRPAFSLYAYWYNITFNQISKTSIWFFFFFGGGGGVWSDFHPKVKAICYMGWYCNVMFITFVSFLSDNLILTWSHMTLCTIQNILNAIMCLEKLHSFIQCLGVVGAVRCLVVGTISKEERPQTGHLWMGQHLTSLKN